MKEIHSLHVSELAMMSRPAFLISTILEYFQKVNTETRNGSLARNAFVSGYQFRLDILR